MQFGSPVGGFLFGLLTSVDFIATNWSRLTFDCLGEGATGADNHKILGLKGGICAHGRLLEIFYFKQRLLALKVTMRENFSSFSANFLSPDRPTSLSFLVLLFLPNFSHQSPHPDNDSRLINTKKNPL